MSIETDQVLIILSVIGRNLDTFLKENAFARVDLKRDMESTLLKLDKLGYDWPGMSNRYWSLSKIEEFFSYVWSLPDNMFKSITLIYVCETLVIDLIEKEKGTWKEKRLDEIYSTVSKLMKFSDPNGLNIPAAEESKIIVNKLYEIIKFKRFGFEKVRRKAKHDSCRSSSTTH